MRGKVNLVKQRDQLTSQNEHQRILYKRLSGSVYVLAKETNVGQRKMDHCLFNIEDLLSRSGVKPSDHHCHNVGIFTVEILLWSSSDFTTANLPVLDLCIAAHSIRMYKFLFYLGLLSTVKKAKALNFIVRRILCDMPSTIHCLLRLFVNSNILSPPLFISSDFIIFETPLAVVYRIKFFSSTEVRSRSSPADSSFRKTLKNVLRIMSFMPTHITR